MRALGAQFRARVHVLAADREGVDDGFRRATAIFREFGIRFWLAAALLDYGEWLSVDGRPDEASPLLAEAREIFERLGAVPWLERLDGIRPEAAVAS